MQALPETLLSNGRKQRLAELPSIFREPLRHYFFDTSYYFSDAVKRDLVFQMEGNGTPGTWTTMAKLYQQAGTKNVRDGIAYLDFKTQLVDEFLLVTDRFSMAHSIEARVPFLDHKLVELVFRIPSSVRTRPENLKYLLKRAVADLLTPELLQAKKRGFVIPIKLWLRNELRPLAESLLSPERLRRQGIFRPTFYQHFVQPHLDGKTDSSSQIWAALMFQLWHLIYIERGATEEPSFSWNEVY